MEVEAKVVTVHIMQPSGSFLVMPIINWSHIRCGHQRGPGYTGGAGILTSPAVIRETLWEEAVGAQGLVVEWESYLPLFVLLWTMS